MKKNKKKVNSKIWLIFSIILIFVIGLILAIYVNEKEKYANLNRLEIVENNISKVFLTTETTLSDIEKVTEHDMTADFIALGEDGFLREKIDSDENISEYVSAQDVYASNVEDKCLNGISYIVSENEIGNLAFEIKPWYFKTYASDVLALATKLMTLEGLDVDSVVNGDKAYDIYEYKAKVKAMQILDEHLDYYDNKDEVRSFTFYFEGNKPAENQYLSLYFNLIGVTSNYMINTDSDLKNQDIRVSEYLEEAITKGIIDVENPLEL